MIKEIHRWQSLLKVQLAADVYILYSMHGFPLSAAKRVSYAIIPPKHAHIALYVCDVVGASSESERDYKRPNFETQYVHN